VPTSTSPVLDGLDRIFDLDPAAWSPRTAIFRVAFEATPPTARPLTTHELFAALRARGFREAKRRGVRGFVGIHVPDEVAALPALVPEHSASSYRRGDRAPEAKRARRVEGPWRGELAASARSRGHDRFTSPATRAAQRDHEALANQIVPLKREARALEQMIGRVYGELPEHHRDARRLRELRDHISDLMAERQAI